MQKQGYSLLQLGIRSSLLKDYSGLEEPTLTSVDSNEGVLELGEEEGSESHTAL